MTNIEPENNKHNDAIFDTINTAQNFALYIIDILKKAEAEIISSSSSSSFDIDDILYIYTAIKNALSLKCSTTTHYVRKYLVKNKVASALTISREVMCSIRQARNILNSFTDDRFLTYIDKTMDSTKPVRFFCTKDATHEDINREEAKFKTYKYDLAMQGRLEPAPKKLLICGQCRYEFKEYYYPGKTQCPECKSIKIAIAHKEVNHV